MVTSNQSYTKILMPFRVPSRKTIFQAIILSVLLYRTETEDSVQESCEEATRFHDETSTVNHEDQMAEIGDSRQSY